MIVPPTEYDPVTGADVGELVEVGQSGVVTTWSWAAAAQEGPAPRPALRLGARATRRGHTAMLHVVDAGSPDAMSSGMRVTARWRPAAERVGRIQDIECFVPEGSEP